MPKYDGQLIIDADHGPDGWEIVVRFDADSTEAGWSAYEEGVPLDDEVLRGLAPDIGQAIVNALIADRDAR